MPTPADIERVRSVVSRLSPIAAVARGELIRAQDWNLVVGALIELAQSLATGTDAPVPPHQHPGQVKLEWLDPSLQTAVEHGPLGEPDAAGRLQAAEREIAALRGTLDAVHGELNQLRLRLSELSGRDLVRESQVQGVQLKLAGASDGREDVLALRTTLQSVQGSVAAAIQAGQGLVVDGKPVDVKGLVERVSGLESFRDGMKTETGQLLDGATIDQRLGAKVNGLVTQGDLQTAIAQRPALPPEQVQALEDRVTAGVKKDVSTTMGQLADTVRAETEQKLAGVQGLVARAVGDALPSVTDGVLAKVRPEITGAVAASSDGLRGMIEQRNGETQATLRAELGKQIGDLRAETAGSLPGQVQKEVAAGLDPIRKQLDEHGARLDGIQKDIQRHDGTIGALGQRVEAVAQGDAAAREQLKVALTDETTQAGALLESKMDARFALADSAGTQKIDAKIAAAQASIAGQIQEQLKAAQPTIAALVDQATTSKLREVSGRLDAIDLQVRRPPR